MQPHFGANRGRGRGFAGDCAAGTGLVGRIRAAGVPPTSPPTPSRCTPRHCCMRRRVPPQTSSRSKPPPQSTLKTRYFSVYLACVRVRLCLRGPFWAFRVPPHVSRGNIKQVPRCRRTGRRSVAVKTGHSTHHVQSFSQGTLKTRYFSVYLAYMCARNFFGVLGFRLRRSRMSTKERADKNPHHHRTRRGAPPKTAPMVPPS